jgi:hypothetical protein
LTMTAMAPDACRRPKQPRKFAGRINAASGPEINASCHHSLRSGRSCRVGAYDAPRRKPTRGRNDGVRHGLRRKARRIPRIPSKRGIGMSVSLAGPDSASSTRHFQTMTTACHWGLLLPTTVTGTAKVSSPSHYRRFPRRPRLRLRAIALLLFRVGFKHRTTFVLH